jgi:hypothetical protein
VVDLLGRPGIVGRLGDLRGDPDDPRANLFRRVARKSGPKTGLAGRDPGGVPDLSWGEPKPVGDRRQVPRRCHSPCRADLAPPHPAPVHRRGRAEGHIADPERLSR